MPCQTAGPTRWGRRAPGDWATKGEVYEAVTCSMPKPSQNHMTAGSDAVISSWSCKDSRIVSTNTWTVMKLWLRISGAASPSSSRLVPADGETRAEESGPGGEAFGGSAWGEAGSA